MTERVDGRNPIHRFYLEEGATVSLGEMIQFVKKQRRSPEGLLRELEYLIKNGRVEVQVEPPDDISNLNSRNLRTYPGEVGLKLIPENGYNADNLR